MKAFLKRLADWSHWPFGLFYFPLFPVWIWYCLKSRSPWFFVSSNPTIAFGGFKGESKSEIYQQLPAEKYPRTITVEAGVPIAELISAMETSAFTFPFVVKPDVGMEGILVRKIADLDQLRIYHSQMPVRYLIQDWVDLPVEASIFYYRSPGRVHGTISGLIRKELGPVGIGNRLYGAVFTDESALISDRLLTAIDTLSANASFFYGRYDIKCSSMAALSEGRDFTILEFNGAGSIPNHVFAGSHSLSAAWSEIARHWRILYRISRNNLKRGTPYPGLWTGWRYLQTAKKHFRNLRRINATIGMRG